MPLREPHEEQANHNNQFWNSLLKRKHSFPDWAVAGMFYEAVHWIEAYLATQSLHSSGHGQRSQTMSQIPALQQDPHLVGDYGVLRTESENARYWCYRHTPQQIVSGLIPLISRLKQTIQALLN